MIHLFSLAPNIEILGLLLDRNVNLDHFSKFFPSFPALKELSLNLTNHSA